MIRGKWALLLAALARAPSGAFGDLQCYNASAQDGDLSLNHRAPPRFGDVNANEDCPIKGTRDDPLPQGTNCSDPFDPDGGPFGCPEGNDFPNPDYTNYCIPPFCPEAESDEPCTEKLCGCTSKEARVIRAQLVLGDGGCEALECDACNEQVTAKLRLTIDNDTGSNIPAFGYYAILEQTFEDGQCGDIETFEIETSCNDERCADEADGLTALDLNETERTPGMPPGEHYFDFGEISFTCGAKLALRDPVLFWTSKGGSCDISGCDKKLTFRTPKCGSVAKIDIEPPPILGIVVSCPEEPFLGPPEDSLVDVTPSDIVSTLDNPSCTWTGPSDTSQDENCTGLTQVERGNWTLQVTYNETSDASCTLSTTTTVSDDDPKCCGFEAECKALETNMPIEGCDASDAFEGFEDAIDDIFVNVTESPCGNLTLTNTTDDSGDICTGLVVTREFTLHDDTDGDGIWDMDTEARQQCNESIIVQDTTAPELSDVPEDTTVQCDAVPIRADPNATDNCTDDSQLQLDFEEVQEDGTCPSNYTLFRTWTATDRCGNNSSETQTITVIDTTPPIVTCPPDTTWQCDDLRNLPDAIESNWPLWWPNATDNCDPFLAGGGPAPENQTTTSCCPFIDPQDTSGVKRTFTVTDACGNSASCDQLITLECSGGEL